MKTTGQRKRALRRATAAMAIVLALCAAATRSFANDEARRPSAAGDPASLKAAYLYNFALYTTWPIGQAASVALCSYGRDDLGVALDALAGRQIDGKPVQVRRIDSVNEAKSCHLLYVSEGAAGSLAPVARALQASPVLVVSDAAGAAEHAMIQIEPDGNRLAFAVNLPRVRSAGLDLSAKLLRLARSVR